MKNNKKKIAVVLLLAVIAVGSYFVSGTYAKYTRALSGSDEATVAKFSVTASGLNKEQNATINLFSTADNKVKDDDLTADEAHVKQGLIAPGTGGQFTTALTNASEVDVQAVVKISEESNPKHVPIEYSLDGTTWKTADQTTKTVDLGYASGSNTGEVVVRWRWAFNGDDTAKSETDTGIGELTEDVKVTTKVSVTFNQVD